MPPRRFDPLRRESDAFRLLVAVALVVGALVVVAAALRWVA